MINDIVLETLNDELENLINEESLLQSYLLWITEDNTLYQQTIIEIEWKQEEIEDKEREIATREKSLYLGV